MGSFEDFIVLTKVWLISVLFACSEQDFYEEAVSAEVEMLLCQPQIDDRGNVHWVSTTKIYVGLNQDASDF
jgi:hypothetical protein